MLPGLPEANHNHEWHRMGFTGHVPARSFCGEFAGAHFFFTGFKTLKLHISVSSMDIIAPALSNSPPAEKRLWLKEPVLKWPPW